MEQQQQQQVEEPAQNRLLRLGNTLVHFISQVGNPEPASKRQDKCLGRPTTKVTRALPGTCSSIRLEAERGKSGAVRKMHYSLGHKFTWKISQKSYCPTNANNNNNNTPLHSCRRANLNTNKSTTTDSFYWVDTEFRAPFGRSVLVAAAARVEAGKCLQVINWAKSAFYWERGFVERKRRWITREFLKSNGVPARCA